MQSARKLVLIDPQVLEQLKTDREYKQIQKPPDKVAKTDLSLSIGKTLDDQSLPDDQKVKRYLQSFHKYMKLDRGRPSETTSLPNPLTEPVETKPNIKKLKKKTGRSSETVSLPNLPIETKPKIRKRKKKTWLNF